MAFARLHPGLDDLARAGEMDEQDRRASILNDMRPVDSLEREIADDRRAFDHRAVRHGHRSVSFSGSPRLTLAMFRSGWRSSLSR